MPLELGGVQVLHELEAETVLDERQGLLLWHLLGDDVFGVVVTPEDFVLASDHQLTLLNLDEVFFLDGYVVAVVVLVLSQITLDEERVIVADFDEFSQNCLGLRIHVFAQFVDLRDSIILHIEIAISFLFRFSFSS